MEMFELVGKRLQVTSKDGSVNLGLGTYLWDDEILLDSGQKILGNHCSWSVTTPSRVPPFTITLTKDARVFDGSEGFHRTEYHLHASEKIEIVEITTRPWNHGSYVVGKFFYNGGIYWLIMSEIVLPQASPHLRLVS